jgi:hypothetical protein
MGIPATSAIHTRISVAFLRDISRYIRITQLITVGSIITAPFWLAALFFTSPQDYSFASSLVCVPVLTIAGAVVIAHVTQTDTYLRRLLLAGLVAHMAASSMFLWIGFHIYGGTVDAFHYWTVGLQLAKEFQIIGWAAFKPPYWSTNLIDNVCGFAALLIGDALPALFILFAFFSLAGGYIFYRAFVVAFPNGDRWLFGLLVILLPSLLFWSSFVGKDAPIQCYIALTCYGFAKLTQRPGPRGVLLCAVGLTGALLIRAHVAAMLAIAMTFPFVVGRQRAGGAGIAARILLIPALIGGTYFLVSQAQSFLYANLNNDSSTSVFQEADTITKTSQIGGSAFNEGTSLPLRIAESPFLLFRPFPWEMRSAIAIAPALESVGMMVLCWMRRREIWSTLRHWRDPFVGFLLMYSVVFLITFGGAISNFGILLRQRIMVTPIALMLICATAKPGLQTAALTENDRARMQTERVRNLVRH